MVTLQLFEIFHLKLIFSLRVVFSYMWSLALNVYYYLIQFFDFLISFFLLFLIPFFEFYWCLKNYKALSEIEKDLKSFCSILPS